MPRRKSSVEAIPNEACMKRKDSPQGHVGMAGDVTGQYREGGVPGVKGRPYLMKVWSTMSDVLEISNQIKTEN